MSASMKVRNLKTHSYFKLNFKQPFIFLDSGVIELAYGNNYTFTCTAQSAPHSMVFKRTTPDDEMITFYNSTAGKTSQH